MYKNNIGSLRFIGAFLVLFGHGFTLSTGKAIVHDPVSHYLMPYTPFHKALPGIGVMMFFVLSGYLITASFQRRKNIVDYCVGRILRIYPALVVAVFFCVLIGLCFTTLSTIEYLTHQGTWRFLLQNNILIYGISSRLPGVFAELPWQYGINGSLWTLPIELKMYFCVLLLGVTRVLNNRILFNLVAVSLIVFFAISPEIFLLPNHTRHAYLGLSFLLGAVLYINQELFRYNIRGLVILTFLSVLSYKTLLYNIASLSLFGYPYYF